jgi:hypothetical protein
MTTLPFLAGRRGVLMQEMCFLLPLGNEKVLCIGGEVEGLFLSGSLSGFLLPKILV